ncbi:hypothetical protein NBRC116602_01200 [Hyphomicrobiales bacterium 4NK60-0047b]
MNMKKELRQKLYRKRSQAFQNDQASEECAALKLVDMARPLLDGSVTHLKLTDTVIAGYIPIGSEIDPRPLMTEFHEKGALLCMPEVVEKNAPLQFRQWSPGDLLISGALGTLQPLSTARILNPDVMFLPLVGVDQMGVRLGQGGGFYDRTIEKYTGEKYSGKELLTIGLAFETQIVDDLPKQPHDQYLDGLISPSFCKMWTEDRQVRYLKQS